MTEAELQRQLDANIPREVISTRSGGGNKQLSYLETWYVIDRMNQVFGSTAWSNELKSLTQLPNTDKPSYMAIVRLTVIDAQGRQSFKDGVGYGSDKSSSNPHELAMKEAASDAFKVAAKNLGRSMGLALYDKSQEYVDETKNTKEDIQTSNNTEALRIQVTEGPIGITNSSGVTHSTHSTSAASTTTKILRQQIKEAYTILTQRKKITKEDFVSNYLGGTLLKDLSDEQVPQVIKAIKTNFTELGL